jgi:hypothetical protein
VNPHSPAVVAPHVAVAFAGAVQA